MVLCGLNIWPLKAPCRSKARLDGRTIVITGGNSGIGKEVARDLYWRGSRLVLLCRDVEKAKRVIEEIKTSPPPRSARHIGGGPGQLTVHPLDLGSFDSVRACAKKVLETEPAIHVLINNAGVLGAPEPTTVDGLDPHFQTNHLSHVLLTLLLLPRIRNSGPGCRIVTVSSALYFYGKFDFEDPTFGKTNNGVASYMHSKLGNIVFMEALTSRFKAEGVDSINLYMLHPGVVNTEIARYLNVSWGALFRWIISLLFFLGLLKDSEEGAQTTIHCVAAKEVADETGFYYSECRKCDLKPAVREPAFIKRAWELTCKFLELDPNLTLKELSQQAAEKRP